MEPGAIPYGHQLLLVIMARTPDAIVAVMAATPLAARWRNRFGAFAPARTVMTALLPSRRR